MRGAASDKSAGRKTYGMPVTLSATGLSVWIGTYHPLVSIIFWTALCVTSYHRYFNTMLCAYCHAPAPHAAMPRGTAERCHSLACHGRAITPRTRAAAPCALAGQPLVCPRIIFASPYCHFLSTSSLLPLEVVTASGLYTHLFLSQMEVHMAQLLSKS